MQMRNIKPRYSNRTGNDISVRLISALLTVVGAAFTAILMLRFIEAAASGWSPTETARSCFYYPVGSPLPDKNELAQSIMSTVFFGTDALYFDKGEENTGVSGITGNSYNDGNTVDPSDATDEQPGESPLEAPTAPITDIYNFDLSRVPKGEKAVIPYDLSLGAVNGELLLSNTTSLPIDPYVYAESPYPIATENTEEPLVLILHTHGTESYSPDGALSVSASAIQRSSDTEENVVAVGRVMCDLLNGAGIPTVHCETMHDLESYRRSYDLAADTVRKYLREYPTVKYVFDVHRDAVYSSDGGLLRPVTVIDGKMCAQVMLVVGTNEKGADHPEWETNFTVAAHLQKKLTSDYTAFARPINIRGASFNEQFAPGSLLIEIGSAGNSLEEAINAAEFLTYSIIDMIKNSSK